MTLRLVSNSPGTVSIFRGARHVKTVRVTETGLPPGFALGTDITAEEACALMNVPIPRSPRHGRFKRLVRWLMR